ncbi:MOSC domain-containing protein YiiM [Roseibium hamelinense]|uniref:MOSC domain-containing protein YiiM n=1 Tax=Roseibium hamelinense TaxID=150831 RepID=A0A562TBG8_9HYPH|nr:MOSC domain-containing protein [Roseibium hamelinense]MTI45486.1 MOSC domain-containing protein [Roseibium hamelinense]TWI90140.1 MOSC domain-containing protein YiiM [Roseibium hamelinense]
MPADLFGHEDIEPAHFTKRQKLPGKVEEVLKTLSPEDFQTKPVEGLDLTFEGIPGDRHAGFTRRSGGREPWYARGTEMCNERQVSILSIEEMDEIAKRMKIPKLAAGWIGANIVTSGLVRLSLIPPRTRLVFEGGVVVRVDGDNVPCRIAGGAIAEHVPGREGLDLLFPKVARRLRGLVGFIEVPGKIKAGETVTAHVPEQWIYKP